MSGVVHGFALAAEHGIAAKDLLALAKGLGTLLPGIMEVTASNNGPRDGESSPWPTSSGIPAATPVSAASGNGLPDGGDGERLDQTAKNARLLCPEGHKGAEAGLRIPSGGYCGQR